MRPLFILYFISCATFLTGCVVEENLNVSPHEFADIVKNNPDIQIIDVRTPQEWKEGK
jgi:hypothetical protein